MKVNTKELIDILTETKNGVEVSLNKGILRVTQEVFLRDNRIYQFSNELRYSFDMENSLEISEFEGLYQNTVWQLYS
jgi:hypothetical protein